MITDINHILSFLTMNSTKYSVQALSRRIHYGKLVAEVKFRESPEEYEPAIRAKVLKVHH